MFQSLAEAIDDAAQRAPEIPIRRAHLDFLYGHSHAEMARPEWERAVRIATALNENLKPLTFPGAAEAVTNALGGDSSFRIQDGTLALCYHGGFAPVRRDVFARLFPQASIITPKAARDGAAALFCAREALLQSRHVLMAPDGRFGKGSGISVLGAEVIVGDGAAFLAHETRCPVVWFDLLWNGAEFAVDVAPGPSRHAAEPFGAFRERLHGFYRERLERAFTGSPWNLPLTVPWRAIFNAMLAGTTYKKRFATA